MDYKEKGSNSLDKLCHRIYDCQKQNGLSISGECKRCGGPLSAYYCEERLYLIACKECGTIVLTKACSPQVAANLTIVEKDANAQNLRLSKIIERARSAEARCETLEKMVKEYQDVIVPGYRERAEKAEKERDAALDLIGWIYYESCVSVEHDMRQHLDWLKAKIEEYRREKEE